MKLLRGLGREVAPAQHGTGFSQLEELAGEIQHPDATGKPWWHRTRAAGLAQRQISLEGGKKVALLTNEEPQD